MKKMLLGIIMLTLIITGCTKLPEQVRNAKAFTEKGYVVQDNLKYELKEYNFGRVIGSEVVESGTYYNVRLQVSNVGEKKQSIPFNEIKLVVNESNLQPDMNSVKKANDKSFLESEIEPDKEVTGWIVFSTKKMPQQAKFYIKESIIEIQ